MPAVCRPNVCIPGPTTTGIQGRVWVQTVEAAAPGSAHHSRRPASIHVVGVGGGHHSQLAFRQQVVGIRPTGKSGGEFT